MSTLSRSFSSRFVNDKSSSPSTVAGAAPEITSQTQSDGAVTRAISYIKELIRRDSTDINESTLSAILDVALHSNSINDRKMLLEHILSFMAKLPPGAVENSVRSAVIKLLYNDLAHPPATYLGNKYAFRQADGGYNNIDVPDMGRAGTPYARSVQQGNPLPANQMPDAGLVFDTLLKRDEFRKHPAGLSSMMFSFAALVIHSVFRTSHKDVNINETSSYVDLSPLYGWNQETQDKVRNRNGRGLLHPDVFAEDRLLLLPPAVCVILVCFSRNHNYIAERLLEINERGSWVDPATLSSSADPQKTAKLAQQDEEIFQIARLCNCAWFASVVFSDYFSAILGLVREGSSWSLAPFDEMRNSDHSFFERGKGNVCSVEFNCLYRWHATTSVQDEQWIQMQFQEIFPGKQPDKITVRDFLEAEVKLKQMEPDVEHWTFGNIKRQADGSFKDSDLGNILNTATSHPAASFGARGTPHIMKLHEVMGIEANRRWGVCSLNDFRKFLGLKPYATFSEWNPNKEVADAAEKLYGDINNLELYVGLQAEDTKPVIEGAGLCPGYTMSRAILSDAIALTRGDRFYTQDYTPFNMTAWGFADCQRTPDGFGFGSTLGRLFLRTLPNQFSKNSVYTWFPLMTPESMDTYLTKLEVIGKYDIKRPAPQPIVSTISEYVEVGDILRNKAFLPVYSSRAAEVIKGKNFFVASADPAQGEKQRKEFLNALAPSLESIDKIGTYFYNKTIELINIHSWRLVDEGVRSVNIARDVLKFVPIHWAANEIAGIPLKSKSNPLGAYTEQELFDVLADIYSFIFLEVEQARYMVLQGKVKGHVEQLLRHIKEGLAINRLSISGLVGTLSSIFTKPKKNGRADLVARLAEIGNSTDELANSILALMLGSTVELSLALTNVLNLLLDGQTDSTFHTLAVSSKPADINNLEAYVLEALRLDPPFEGVFRIANQPVTVGSLSIQSSHRVFLDIAAANKNGDVFPNPQTFDATRAPKERYLKGDGVYSILGNEITPKVMVQVLRAILSYDGVKRGPGKSGKLPRFKCGANPMLNWAYIDSNQNISPWPTSLIIQYNVPAVGSSVA